MGSSPPFFKALDPACPLFDFLNLFINISDYLNLWDIFRFVFRQFKMTFFHKIMVAEKSNFSSNA